jgi:hypothetical protein
MKKVKLAIDFGSANMKMVGIINDDYQKKIIKSLATTNGIGDKNAVELNGRKVYFGIGDPLVRLNKTKREYIIESVFLATNAIYKELDNDFEIQLSIGLPLNEYMSPQKDIYKAELENLYLNKQLIGCVDENEIKIKVTYLNIYAEGYSGFIALMDNIDTTLPVLIIDIGYKTTDIVGIKYDSFTNELMVDSYGNIPNGMLEILKDITKQFNNDNKTNISVNIIEDALVNNTDIQVYTDKGRETRKLSQWLEYGDKKLMSILNEIEVSFFPDMKSRNVYIIGGGVEIINYILGEISNKNKSDSIETEKFKNNKENDIMMFANVKGYLLQLIKDTTDIVGAEDVIINEDKLDNIKQSIALTN